MTGIRALVCGGRKFAAKAFLFAALDKLHAEQGFTVVIQGGATGADALAMAWAIRRDVPYLTFAADWDASGPAAGPIRNQRMLTEGKPDLVVAFPGGRGTDSMVRLANRAGVKVIRIRQEEQA